MQLRDSGAFDAFADRTGEYTGDQCVGTDTEDRHITGGWKHTKIDQPHDPGRITAAGGYGHCIWHPGGSLAGIGLGGIPGSGWFQTGIQFPIRWYTGNSGSGNFYRCNGSHFACPSGSENGDCGSATLRVMWFDWELKQRMVNIRRFLIIVILNACYGRRPLWVLHGSLEL